MSFSIHNIIISYKGKKSTVPYWADGHGRRVDSFVTSLAQLRVMLQKKFGQSALDLYYVDERRLRPISSDRHMISALENIRKGGTLLVQAYEHKNIDFSIASRLRRQGAAQATR